MSDNNYISIDKMRDIRNKMQFYIMNSILGVSTKKMRGITLNYKNNIMDITIFFDSELTEEETDEMQQADTDAISSASPILFDWQGNPIINIDEMNLHLCVIPTSIDLIDKKGNLGWIYLRKEY